MNSTTNAGFQCVKCGRMMADITWVGNEGPYCGQCSARFLHPVDTGEIYSAQVSVNEPMCIWTETEGGAVTSCCQPAYEWESVGTVAFVFCPYCGGRIVRNTP